MEESPDDVLCLLQRFVIMTLILIYNHLTASQLYITMYELVSRILLENYHIIVCVST